MTEFVPLTEMLVDEVGEGGLDEVELLLGVVPPGVHGVVRRDGDAVTQVAQVKLSVINYQLSVISYQLSIISSQLSVISYQLSVISYQLSVTSYQLSVISYQLSVISYQSR
jgi:hypothetical protein